MQKEKFWPKVITERPRVGGTRQAGSRADRSIERRARQRDDLDALPRHAPMFESSQFLADDGLAKEFTDHLNPLHRWLYAQRGRQWDDVFSEARRMIDVRSTTGRHVFQHLMQWVEQDPVVLDGKLHYRSRFGGDLLPIVSRSGYWHFYVLADGVLRVAPVPPPLKREAWSYKPKRTQNPVHKVGEREYEKIGGIWYEVWTAEKDNYGKPRDAWGNWLGSRITVVVQKRQLGKRELRDLGLANG